MPARKRVLVIDNLAVESARRSLYRAIHQRGEFEMHLLVPRQWKETTHVVACEPEVPEDPDVHPSGILFGFRHHRVLYAGLFSIMREIRPDFVLAVHAPENYATFQLLVARRFLNPYVKLGLFASRNIDLPSVGFPYKLSIFNSFCDRMTASKKVDVVFHRPQACGHLYRRYTNNVVYLPHSVDCRLFKADNVVRNGRNDHPVVGYVGRLVEAKGVHLLIEAIARIPGGVSLRITGEGPSRPRLEALAKKLGASERVRFSDPVPYSAMPALLNTFDVLVLPSLETEHWRELFGRVLIEAMACEVPVLASSSGGIPGVVGDAGVLFRPGSVEDLSRKIQDLLADQQVREVLAAKGRARVLRDFDVPVVAEHLAGELARLLQK